MLQDDAPSCLCVNLSHYERFLQIVCNLLGFSLTFSVRGMNDFSGR